MNTTVKVSLFMLFAVMNGGICAESAQLREYCKQQEEAAKQQHDERWPRWQELEKEYKKEDGEIYRLSIRARFYEELPVCMSYKSGLSDIKAAGQCFEVVAEYLAKLHQIFAPDNNRDDILLEEVQRIGEEVGEQLGVKE